MRQVGLGGPHGAHGSGAQRRGGRPAEVQQRPPPAGALRDPPAERGAGRGPPEPPQQRLPGQRAGGGGGDRGAPQSLGTPQQQGAPRRPPRQQPRPGGQLWVFQSPQCCDPPLLASPEASHLPKHKDPPNAGNLEEERRTGH